jgi:hypothetical protein
VFFKNYIKLKMMEDLFSQENGMFDIISTNTINTDYKKDKDSKLILNYIQIFTHALFRSILN